MKVCFQASCTEYLKSVLPSIDNWISIELRQELMNGQYINSIFIGGIKVRWGQTNRGNTFRTGTSYPQPQPQEFSNVKVFASIPGNMAQPGSIRNLVVQTETQEKWTDGGEVIFTGDISSVEARGSGLPKSVFPGTDSETVCSQTTCDPQISELYKNASFIVAENIQRIDIINKEKDISWVAVANTFLAVSYSEVQAYRMGEIPPTREERRQTPARNKARQLFLDDMESKRKDQVNIPSPLEVFTTDANNQGECSSCAAFAVTAALETCIQKVIPNPAFSIAPPRGLSSQNMLDCAFGSPGVFGCDGGQSFRYLKWLENATLDTNRQYPYLDSSIRFEGLNNAYRTCYKSGSTSAAVMEESHSSWDNHTERDLENILLEGHAIITTIDVQEDLMFYEAGVYQSSKCQDWSLGSDRDFQWEEGSDFRPLRHAVVIVGLGLENGQKYWKVKNSWGENWGSSGFFKIIRNGTAHCGLGSYFSVALCKKCTSGNNCETKNQGPVQPMRRPPPNLPKEGVSEAFTSHLATPLGGAGLTTCSTCAGLSECPKLVPCRKMDKCCTMQGGSGIRLYCPSIC
eukprot:GFUD01007215.1.p1 GENE.GFUD01007215.1~~GFUD01007215.1.p1  ORF type:complete len:573 (+),score=84.46 GFUD01007215.1:274-1992(+)